MAGKWGLSSNAKGARIGDELESVILRGARGGVGKKSSCVRRKRGSAKKDFLIYKREELLLRNHLLCKAELPFRGARVKFPKKIMAYGGLNCKGGVCLDRVPVPSYCRQGGARTGLHRTFYNISSIGGDTLSGGSLGWGII